MDSILWLAVLNHTQVLYLKDEPFYSVCVAQDPSQNLQVVSLNEVGEDVKVCDREEARYEVFRSMSTGWMLRFLFYNMCCEGYE